MKRDAPTINDQATEWLNTNNREEKKGNEGSSAKKRDITAVDGLSSETAPKRTKRVVSKISNKSLRYRLVRNIANPRIRMSNYRPLKHYTPKLPTIPEE